MIRRREGAYGSVLSFFDCLLLIESCRYGPVSKLRFKYTMAQWAKRPEVTKAWKELADKYDLVEKELRDVDRVFSFLDAFICCAAPMNFRYTTCAVS